MSDRFLHLANKALDNEFVGQRLVLCRKAAEVLCKNISPEPFPIKIGNNLSRMIDFLFSKQILDAEVKAHLDCIRNYGNLGVHEEVGEFPSVAVRGALAELKKWYQTEYNPFQPELVDIDARDSVANTKLGWALECEVKPSCVVHGKKPFGLDCMHGFLERHELAGWYMHDIGTSWCPSGDLWIVLGHEGIASKTLEKIKNPSLLISSFISAIPGMPSYGFEGDISEITDFKISPLDLEFWNIVVMGQEACLDFLFEKNVDITQEDIFNHPLHSRHPAVKKFGEIKD